MNSRDYYQRIFENGESLIKSAVKLAELEQFGTAISLLILGLEELIKYQVFLNNIGEEKVLDQSEFEKTFYDRRTKHKLIMEFQEAIASDFVEDFHQFVFRKASGQELNEKDLIIEQNRFKDMGSFLSIAYSEINLKDEGKVEFRNWLIQANELKDKGFYVGFKNDEWTFPSEFVQQDYDSALKFVTVVKKQVEVSKSLDLTYQEFIDLMNQKI